MLVIIDLLGEEETSVAHCMLNVLHGHKTADLIGLIKQLAM